MEDLNNYRSTICLLLNKEYDYLEMRIDYFDYTYFSSSCV